MQGKGYLYLEAYSQIDNLKVVQTQFARFIIKNSNTDDSTRAAMAGKGHFHVYAFCYLYFDVWADVTTA